MLKKMGWEGAGLGAEEQGIQEPVKGGEVRDKLDKYKVSRIQRLIKDRKFQVCQKGDAGHLPIVHIYYFCVTLQNFRRNGTGNVPIV